MAFSVNTNTGAMAALQSLNATNKGLDQVQSRINTGLKVSSTKDDSASYTIAQTLRGDQGGLQAVSSSLSRAKSVTDVAVAGAESISDIVNQMKQKAKQASDDGIDSESRIAINKDFEALRDQIKTIVDSSTFNGTNLLKASGGTVTALKSIIDADSASGTYTPDQLSVSNLELDLGKSGGTFEKLTTGSKIDTAADAKTMVANLEIIGKNLNGKLSTLGAASRAIDAQASYTSKLSDVVESGIGSLVDADLAKESARLQGLQVKQQLGVQALSIANQAPQSITSLFR
ncbi:flagellin [Sphingosinicella sp. BN140058]|uniref:flagellin n=1 Tax=Sphingosinicella sp. BN140058 TaxID=1892855 RepID=UPI001010FBF2|nr:flagellin [Sphingosinicella sp. BN140058]QAY75857.1 flagellin [Sphingosinicella sp. BN140058]